MENIANILIVDDNERNRQLLNKMILAMGHFPVLASDGMVALSQLKARDIDIVLLDILMPEMDGYETLKRIKDDPGICDVPVIMVSALDDIDSVVRCIGSGAVDYLTKPFNPVLLKTRIETCFEQKLLRDQEKQTHTELKKLHEELKKNYDALNRTEQSRDALTHMIVHDLRNPLTVIIGIAQLLVCSNDKQSISRNIPKILSSAENMEALIMNILDVSKFESGKMTVSNSTLNMSHLMNEVYTPFIPIAREKDIQLSIESDQSEIETIADKELMSRIMQNLINNSLKHTESYVKISTRIVDDGSIISVTDDGPGIPDEYKDKIFSKYFQILTRENINRYGVGLGLAFCKMAVEAQKGKIWVECDKDRGSSFYVKLNIPELN